MDVVLVEPHTLKCIISKWLVTCLPPHSETQPHIVCLQCTLRKTPKIWHKKICQGSCHLQCFGSYEHPSCLNSWSGGTKAPTNHLPLEITSYRPHLLYAYLWNSFGYIIVRFYNVFVYIKFNIQIIGHKFAYQKQIGMQLGHVEHIFDTNLVGLLLTNFSITINSIPMT